MLAGRQPYRAGSAVETLQAVLSHEPVSLSKVNPAVPPELAHLIHRCMEKSADGRFATVDEVTAAVDALVRARSLPPPQSQFALMRRPAVIAVAVLVLLAMAAGGWRWRVHASRLHWARTVAAPAAERLMNHGDYTEAYSLARQALDIAPDEPSLQQLWLDVSIPSFVVTQPAGADVAFARYGTRTSQWYPLGQTPLDGVRMPRGQVRVRITKNGFQPIEASRSPPGEPYRLDPLRGDSAGHGARRRRPRSRALRPRRQSRRLLDRSIRNHQPAVQRVRRPRGLSPIILLAGAVPRGGSRRAVG